MAPSLSALHGAELGEGVALGDDELAVLVRVRVRVRVKVRVRVRRAPPRRARGARPRGMPPG